MEWRCPRSGRRSVARFVGQKIHHLNEIFQALRHWHCNHLCKRLGHSWSRPNHLSALFQNLRKWHSCGAHTTLTISSKICGRGLVVGAKYHLDWLSPIFRRWHMLVGWLLQPEIFLHGTSPSTFCSSHLRCRACSRSDKFLPDHLSKRTLLC